MGDPSRKRRMSVKRKAEVVATRNRRQQVEEMILAGVTNQHQMAARLGVVDSTICNDVKWILKNWLDIDSKNAQYNRAKRVKQHEAGAFEALQAYKRSCDNAEEVRTTTSRQRCPDCRGTGMVGETEEWCSNCNGEGEVDVEVINKSVKGQAGDSAHLREYRENIKECARLEGLHHHTVVPPAPNIQIGGQALHVHADGNKYKDVPENVLLEAMSAIAKLKESAGQVIDVETTKEKENEDDR